MEKELDTDIMPNDEEVQKPSQITTMDTASPSEQTSGKKEKEEVNQAHGSGTPAQTDQGKKKKQWGGKVAPYHGASYPKTHHSRCCLFVCCCDSSCCNHDGCCAWGCDSCATTNCCDWDCPDCECSWLSSCGDCCSSICKICSGDCLETLCKVLCCCCTLLSS